ncbi:unnamed protein product, partial [Mesorhabditis belari]|uniref:SXP/RAL-2 family protein Ani s 5-like cation-binding domain-containing protein n=1 Tax=Mesorhabditis belari TaxID=2138241 RepID=A0AAF3J622_9BILA
MQRFLLAASLILMGVLAGPGGGRGGSLPFLQGLSQQQMQQYYQLDQAQNITKAQIDQQITQWASNIGGQTLQLYNQFEANVTRFKNQVNQNRTRILQQLPTVVNRLQTFFDNQQITPAQERQQVQEYLRSLNDPALAGIAMKIAMLGKEGHDEHMGGPKGGMGMGGMGGGPRGGMGGPMMGGQGGQGGQGGFGQGGMNGMNGNMGMNNQGQNFGNNN